MSLESDLFQKKKPDFKKLKAYGFSQNKDTYLYRRLFFDDTFEAIFSVKKDGSVFGKVIDVELQEEYALVHTKTQNAYASEVRNAYLEILEDIARNCFENVPFLFPQTNRIASYIKKTYGDEPDVPWKKPLGATVFRNHQNKKWYGLVMEIKRNLLDGSDNEETIEVLNLKVAPENHDFYLTQPQIYPAYHMNKKNWISIVLDESLKDSTIYPILEESHQFTVTSNPSLSPSDWLVPANPIYYDVIGAFKKNKIVNWHTKKKMNVGDIVYIYSAKPIGAIVLKTKVIERLSNGSTTLQALHFYKENEYPLEELRKHGLKTVRFASRLPQSVKEYIEK